MLTRFGAGIDARVRLIGAASSVGLRDSYLRPGMANSPAAGGFNQSSSAPIGNRPPVAFIPAMKDGGLAGRVSVTADTSGAVTATGRCAATLTCVPTVSAAINRGAQISGSALGQASSTSDLVASGVLFSELLIGASPSAIDIADQVWSRQMAPFTTSGTFGYKLSNLSGGGGGGGGATAAEVADAVWAYVTRSLTASPGPSAATIAAQIRTELAVELGRIDATISSRLASAGYTAPDNTSVSAIKAKTDNLPSDPASNTQVNTRLATSSYTAPPTAALNASAVRTELTTELGRIDTAVSSRLAGSSYVAPTTPPTVVQIRQEMDTNSTKLDVAVSSRLATGSYVAPDNSSITAIKAKTDNLPASPASESSVTARPTLSQIESSTVLAKEATVAAKASQTSVDQVKANTDLIPAGL